MGDLYQCTFYCCSKATQNPIWGWWGIGVVWARKRHQVEIQTQNCQRSVSSPYQNVTDGWPPWTSTTKRGKEPIGRGKKFTLLHGRETFTVTWVSCWSLCVFVCQSVSQCLCPPKPCMQEFSKTIRARLFKFLHTGNIMVPYQVMVKSWLYQLLVIVTFISKGCYV